MTYLRTITLLAALLIPTVAQAQEFCDKRNVMVSRLTLKYSEEQLGLGLSGSLLIELWASREPPYTWTILKTYPNGISCVAATGTNGHWKDNDPRAFRAPIRNTP